MKRCLQPSYRYGRYFKICGSTFFHSLAPTRFQRNITDFDVNFLMIQKFGFTYLIGNLNYETLLLGQICGIIIQ